MRATLLPLVLTAAVATAATPTPDPAVAFTATARKRVVPVALRPHAEEVARRWGTWSRPADWRWRSDAAQVAWMLENRVELPRCRVVIRRRVSRSQAQNATTSAPPVSGRVLVNRILAVPESTSLPEREFVVPLDAPDALLPAATCVEDPLAPLRTRLAKLQRGQEACVAAAVAAEARIKPLHMRLIFSAADSYRRCGDLNSMERILRRAVQVFGEHHPSHPERPQALYELGTLLVSHGRLREGEVQMRRAVDLTLAAGVHGTDLAIAIEELVALYESLGNAY